MTEKKLHLKITTHEKIIFDSDVDEIYLKGTKGEFGILPGHIPFMSALDIGIAKVITKGQTERFTIMGGIFQLQGNEALILTQVAENAEEIDVERAKEAEKRARERLEEGPEGANVQRAEVALARAIARLKASQK